MDQHSLRQPKGAKHARKRIGRGVSSGQGTYAGRGLKGQKARGSVHPRFEGGQNPLVRRIGHLRGFRNFTRVEFQAVNLDDLEERFSAGDRVDGEALVARGLLDDADQPFKVLGRGELSHALTVVAPRLSGAARDAITKAGGSFEETAPAVRKVRNRIHRRRQAEAAAPAASGAAADAGGAGAGEAEEAQGS